jgi:hypothetical protein
MSSNRLMYDTCEYKQRLQESVSSIDFLLDPLKYEHQNRCRMELGLVGGTNVSHVKGNLVDLENDLRGQNRPATNCAEYKFIPSNEVYVQGKEYIKPVNHPKVDTTMQHLPACQMIDYKSIPRPTFKNNNKISY